MTKKLRDADKILSCHITTQIKFTCSESTTEEIEEDTKYVHS